MPTPTRFELIQDGKTSFLDYETDGQGWITLVHTEVPPEQRGQGLGLKLVTTAFQYAADHHLKVEVLCPFVRHIVRNHPEFQAQVHKR